MKSGFVMLAGRSNVGKSTLLNALIGTKVSIVSPKPQTTRHPIRGILHDARGQLVFVDTPGVFLGRKDRVSTTLNEFVHETLDGVDAVIYVMDPSRDIGAEELYIQNLLRQIKVPVIALINKMDLPESERSFTETYRAVDVGQSQNFELSAINRKNLNRLIDVLFTLSQNGDAHYPDLQLTDIGHNQWLEELIREKIFLNLNEELPYSIKVSLDELETRPDGSRYIAASIWTTDERYKRMIIGAKAQMLKKIGAAARNELEHVTGTKIFLELTVKVDPKWQERFV
ncbi:GTPase Era [Candidatus Uhrbacteria bacterium]|nr:GTPase Era [Candidatus Uhrbacteria bacterium]